MKKALTFFYIFGGFVSASFADYTGYLSPISLPGGTAQTHNAIATCTYYDCTFGYSGSSSYDVSYTTTGSGTSSLTLNAILPTNAPNTAQKTIKFYMNTATINPNSKLVLNNFNSILLEKAMNINNASLAFNADTTSTTSSFQINPPQLALRLQTTPP